MATVTPGLNSDFDRLQELANQPKTLRQMLGHSGREETTIYKLQTLIDNVSALTPSVLADLNQVIVESGHEVAKNLAKHYARAVNPLWLKQMCTIPPISTC